MFSSLVLVLSLAAPAQSPTIGEAPALPPAANWVQLTAKPGKIVRIASDATARWALVEETAPAEVVASADGLTAIFVAEKPGRYRVVAAGEKGEIVRVIIVVGDAPPGPVPLPVDPVKPPTPMPPPDVLKAKFAAAYALDKSDPVKRAECLADLMELYAQATKLANDPAILTTADLAARVRAASVMLVPTGLADLRRAIAVEIVVVMPTDTALTADSRKAVAALFARISLVLKEIK